MTRGHRTPAGSFSPSAPPRPLTPGWERGREPGPGRVYYFLPLPLLWQHDEESETEFGDRLFLFYHRHMAWPQEAHGLMFWAVSIIIKQFDELLLTSAGASSLEYGHGLWRGRKYKTNSEKSNNCLSSSLKPNLESHCFGHDPNRAAPNFDNQVICWLFFWLVTFITSPAHACEHPVIPVSLP